MKTKIPKGKTPSLIGAANGRPKKVNALRKSSCARCKGEILGGSSCFEIPQAGNGFTSQKRFCTECYKKVIEQTEKDLSELKSEI